MAVRAGTTTSESFATYIDVFTNELWYLIFGSTLVLAIAVGLFENLYYHGQRREQLRDVNVQRELLRAHHDHEQRVVCKLYTQYLFKHLPANTAV